MHFDSEIVDIDDEFIELMIDRCFTIDQYVRVTNHGQFYAELRYRIYRYKGKNSIHEKTEEKNVLELKYIFKRLIYKYKNFEHQGYHYSFGRGKWSKSRL